jgi:hypothetical protein
VVSGIASRAESIGKVEDALGFDYVMPVGMQGGTQHTPHLHFVIDYQYFLNYHARPARKLTNVCCTSYP